ncbi:MAG TPA: YdcF family protein [Cyanothece sp. UBA12306]|nr:YdcF family protein [Cyanothece sp. UBA12306]
MFLKISSRRHSVPVSSTPKIRHRILAVLPLVGFSLWLGYKQLQSYLVQPEAIFVLGGHEERERFAAQLAIQHPSLPIWVSSGSPQGYVRKIFTKAGISGDRLHLDYQAKDTVTNFTTLVNQFKAQGIDSIYLVTSANHLPRARVIGEIIFGSQGIIIKPMPVNSDRPPESWEKILRDGARSLLWIATGKTGESLTFKRFH